MTEIAVQPLHISSRRLLWIVLVGVACAVLLAGAFILGRATVTTHGSTIQPVTRSVLQPAPAGGPDHVTCHGYGPC